MMDEEVLAFFNTTDSWKQLMAISDLGTVRILEDLIDVLVRKNIIHFTELPEQAQQRIRERKQSSGKDRFAEPAGTRHNLRQACQLLTGIPPLHRVRICSVMLHLPRVLQPAAAFR